jgi:AraC-like DNA-binding protein
MQRHSFSVAIWPHRPAYESTPLIQLLASRGHDVDAVLAATEIPRLVLEEPGFRIIVEQEIAFSLRALSLIDDSCAALEVGGRFHLSMFGLLGLASACAPTARDAFHMFVSYPALAGSRHMTTGTLQRRLETEGSRFSEVLREVRMARAYELLRQRSLHVEEIAFRLGFRDPDAFSRAFRGWCGRSPSERRRNLKS